MIKKPITDDSLQYRFPSSMKVLSRLLLLLMQLAVLVPLAIYLGSVVNFTKDSQSVLKRRSMDSEIPKGLQENVSTEFEDGEREEYQDTDMQPDRGITTIPTSKQDLLNEMDIQVPAPPLLPFGPDESPPRKPAVIPTNFPIDEPDFCTRRPGLEIISYIHSSIGGVKHRHETRITWANATAYKFGVNIGVVFMVGRPKNDAEKLILKQESERYHDIVQGDYSDHYRLLSYKGLASLYWINKHCSHVPWTLHSDDDVFIDIFLYNEELKKLSEDLKKKFICSHMGGPALRSGRWYVSYEQYPAKNYPLYCSGGAWFLQTQYIPRLLNASTVVPFLWVDDAYLTGLLAVEAGIPRHGFQKYYGHPKPTLEEIGQKVAWFFLKQPRLEWWEKVVEFHQNKKRYSRYDKYRA